MKQFLVSLNLITNNLFDENRIKTIMDGDSNMTSRSFDDKIMWCIESPLDQKEPVLVHIKKIISDISTMKLREIEESILEMYFDIGILYNTYTCSITMPSECINIINSFNAKAGVAIACYPSDE